MNPLVMHIQKCSIHDGPGIRTTVFFKGCPLSCAWCHNPESQLYAKELLYDKEKCVRCNVCIDNCVHNSLYEFQGKIGLDKEKCVKCGNCIDVCIYNARQMVGKQYSVEQLIHEIEKDRIFYEESGGGVTLSGGEVMAQDINFISHLVMQCRNKGIHVAIDTCGYAPYKHFQKIINDTDLFLYDIKMMDMEKHIRYTGRSNKIILENLQKLANDHENIYLRIPLIQGVNMDEDHKEIYKIVSFAESLGIDKINLLPYHDIGKHKYEKLYLTYSGEFFEKPGDKQIEEIRQICINKDFHVKIGG